MRLRDSGSDLRTVVSGHLCPEDRHLLREVIILLIIKITLVVIYWCVYQAVC